MAFPKSVVIIHLVGGLRLVRLLGICRTAFDGPEGTVVHHQNKPIINTVKKHWDRNGYSYNMYHLLSKISTALLS